MGKAQRTKGAAGERELCHILSNELGAAVRRNLSQSRDGGCDIAVGGYRVEVKRRAKLGNLYEWMNQAEASCAGSSAKPVVVCRADGKGWLAVLPLGDWLRLAREDLAQ